MILFTSSKGQDYSPFPSPLPPTEPELQHKAVQLNQLLTQLDASGIQQLMGISDSLTARTLDEIASWPRSPRKPALFTYCGEAFRSLDPAQLSDEELIYAQANLRILSGLYGILRPVDLIAPHRLEMGYRLVNPAGSTLYPFWRSDITALLNAALAATTSPWLINLASVEYSKVVDRNRLARPMLDIQFKEESGGKHKTVAVHAKRARGMMAHFLLENRSQSLDTLCTFTGGGYRFRSELSKDNLLVFTRPQP